MFSVHTWIHLITVTALAMVYKEYSTLQHILQEEHRVKLWSSGPLPVSPGSYNVPQNPFQPPIPAEFGTLTEETTGDILDIIESHGSSLWCEGTSHQDRFCHFTNVCYMPEYDDILFFHHHNSVLSNVPSDLFSPALLELSSVTRHNQFHFNYVDVPASEARTVLKDVDFIEAKVLAFKRFLPDNVMHVFHDDLLPAFVTLQRIHTKSQGKFSAKVLFLDDYEKGPFWPLYNSLTNTEVMLKSNLHKNRPTCFKNIRFGVSKETTWYDYGFREPQKPIENATVTGNTIRLFTDHIKAGLGIAVKQPPPNQKRKLAVLLARKDNRIIVNQNDLISELVAMQYKVATVALEEVTLKYAIEEISQASLIIGMHGSLLILSMFAPPKALVVELFPYAINPENYTPFKTLLTLPDMDVTYRAWGNLDSEKSIPHPDWSKELGGIMHLSTVEQEQIMRSSKVPKHLCCSDPEFLYRIYQDTIVDSIEVRLLIEEHPNQVSQAGEGYLHSSSTDKLLKRRMLPSAVQDLECKPLLGKSQPVLQISWQEPWNVQYLKHSSAIYEVLLQDSESQIIQQWMLKTTVHQFMEGISADQQYFVWVRAILDDNLPGPYNTEVTCHT